MLAGIRTTIIFFEIFIISSSLLIIKYAEIEIDTLLIKIVCFEHRKEV